MDPLSVQGNKNVPFSLFSFLHSFNIMERRAFASSSFASSLSLLLLFGLLASFCLSFCPAWPDQIGIICLADRAKQSKKVASNLKWQSSLMTVLTSNERLGGEEELEETETAALNLSTHLQLPLCACVCLPAILTLFLTSINDLADSLWNFAWNLINFSTTSG